MEETATAAATRTRARKKAPRLTRREFYERTFIEWVARHGVSAMGNLRPFLSNMPKAYDAYVELMEMADADD